MISQCYSRKFKGEVDHSTADPGSFVVELSERQAYPVTVCINGSGAECRVVPGSKSVIAAVGIV
jgi:hypothetical protein